MRGYYQCLLQALQEGWGGVAATVVASENPAYVAGKMYCDARGQVRWQPEPAALAEKLVGILRDSPPKEPSLVEVNGVGTIYVEPVGLGPHVLILGGGHVSQALAKVLAILRYETTVVDDRPEFANQSIFPTAARVICGDFLEVLARYPFTGNTFVVIVTRGHRHDYTCLWAVIDKPAGYIGMIGSRRKVNAVFQALEEEGVAKEKLAAVHAPIGLDIGAQTPEEIAVSIAAEIIAVNNRTRGERLDPTWLQKVVAVEEPAAVATVVRVRGSAPRQAGARMLVLADGQIFGSVGGGCGEAEVRLAAVDVIRSGQPRMVSLNLTRDLAEDEGMICGGLVDVFVEPLQG